MAVPKKKKSKSKTAIRKNAWKKLILKKARTALNLAKSISKNNSHNFISKDKKKD